MKTILTYGTFDLFHYGHLKILERASKYGTYLIVGLSSDGFNEIKGKKSIHSFNERKKNLRLIRSVNHIIEESTWEQKVNDIIKYKVDIIVMGDDWIGKFDYLKEYCDVIYLPRTPDISSSLLKTMWENHK